MSQVKNDRTTNEQLINFAKNYNVNVKVMMNDQFTVPLNGYYILNLENKGKSGSHWVCVICKTENCFYMDSFGAPPTKNVTMRLKEKYNKIYMNNVIIQDLDSEMCGWFCMGLIMYVHKHPYLDLIKACDEYINMFDDDTDRNNAILKKYFNSLKHD